MVQKKYTVDLAGQLAECEANYARIMQLLPNMGTEDHRLFTVDLAAERQVQFHIEVRERCKYTTMVDVIQTTDFSDAQPWAIAPRFSLRVYHDAKMAEVIAFDRHHRLRASYEYPNDKMYQRDEKIQLNTFLGEWLSHCLKHGREAGDSTDQPLFASAPS